MFFRQLDFGLETYATKDLFVRLLTPTFFVIITVLQIHYFHKDFLEVTTIDKIGCVTYISSYSNNVYEYLYQFLDQKASLDAPVWDIFLMQIFRYPHRQRRLHSLKTKNIRSIR